MIVNGNIDNFKVFYEESVLYFKRLENLKKIRRTNDPATLPVDNKKPVTVTSFVGKFSKNAKSSSMQCHYCDKNNHITLIS
jgi:hypothetical protein